MEQEFSNNIVELAYHGIDENISPDQTTVVSLRDLMRVHATLAELMQFFHQPLHMQTLEDVEDYMGTVDTNGAFKLLHAARYEIMQRMLPKEVDELFDRGVFDVSQSPYYFEDKSKNQT